jgi:hypothetical protein
MGSANENNIKEYERLVIKAVLCDKAGLLYLDARVFFKAGLHYKLRISCSMKLHMLIIFDTSQLYFSLVDRVIH